MTETGKHGGTGLLRRVFAYGLSSVGTVIIALITVQFATRVLGPTDYGLFAVAIALPSVASGLAAAATGYTLQVHLPTAGDRERIDLISTALCMVGGLSILLSGVLVAGILALPSPVMGIRQSDFALAILAGFLGFPWLVATEVLTLEGRAGPFSAITIGQSLLGSAATLVGLFWFNMGGTSLFIGPVVGAFVAFSGSCAVLWDRVGRPRTTHWFRDMGESFWARATANLFEHGQTVIERWLLASFVDLRAVGIFNHAQQYRTYAMQGVNAVSRGTWPNYLAEAREDPPQFRFADETWRLVHVGILLLGLTFALIGGEIIGFLTNGKFVDAHIYATLLILVLLVQASGKSQMTLLIARGRGRLYSNMTTVSIALHIACMAVLVPYVGMGGVLASIFAQVVFLRTGVYWAAGRIAKVPFRDEWVVMGVILVPFFLLANLLLELPFSARLVILAITVATVALVARARLSAFLAMGRKVFRDA